MDRPMSGIMRHGEKEAREETAPAEDERPLRTLGRFLAALGLLALVAGWLSTQSSDIQAQWAEQARVCPCR